MRHNLSLPENNGKAFVAKCQYQAGLWLHQLKSRPPKISRPEIRRLLEEISDDVEREEIRKWLNKYR